MIGKIVAISDINVSIFADYPQEVKISDILYTEVQSKIYRFEVVEIKNNTITTIPFSSVIGLKRGLAVYPLKKGLSIEYSKEILGRVFNSYGELIDGTVIEIPNERSIYNRHLTIADINVNNEILGISPLQEK